MVPTIEEIEEADENREMALCRELCERRLAAYPDDAWVLYLYAGQLIELNSFTEADQVLQKAERLTEPKLLHWVLCRRGALYEKMGNWGGAIDVYLDAHRLKPSEVGPLVFAAVTLHRAGRLEEAIEIAIKATQCSEGAIDEAYFNLGGFYLVQRRYEEARTCYQRVLEIDPTDESSQRWLDDLEKVFALIQTEQSHLYVLPDPNLNRKQVVRAKD